MDHSSKNNIIIGIRAEKGASLPKYMTEGAAGADITAFLEQDVLIEAGRFAIIPTGLFSEIPQGYEIQVRPRSGLAFKDQITVLNTPGTIDADYRGEIKIALINLSDRSFIVTNGMRIAQLVVSPVLRGSFNLVDALTETKRGINGFGHTGR